MASYQGMLTLVVTVVLLALPSLTSGVTLHVRPTSTNTACPTHPCHTLSEYAHDPGQYFNESNLTLLFLPGNHTLIMNVTMTNIHRLEILGKSSAMVPTTVLCSSYVGFTFRDIFEVRINGLAFVTCARFRVVQIGQFYPETAYYGLHLQSVQVAEITDCSFQDSYGSALGVVDSDVVLRGNRFLNNCRLCKQDGECYLNCYGGGVYAKKSNLIFTGSSNFIGNLAWYGAGIFVWENANLIMNENTTFTNNSVKKHGGGVYASSNSNLTISGNTVFTKNSATHQGGGVFIGSNSNANISGNVTFIANSAGGHGGGVCIGSNSTLTVSENTTFITNLAKRAGGGVYVASSSNVSIHGNTTFHGNSAGDGGGIFIEASTSIYISGNTIFIRNSARNNPKRYDLLENHYKLNLTMWSGGGVYAEPNSKLNISGNTKFIGNSAVRRGGGILADNSNINIGGNTILVRNTAKDGGGIYAGSNITVNVGRNTAFNDNSPSDCGAGINTWANNNVIISGNTTFIRNSARFRGGGVFANDNNVYIRGNATFGGNTATDGGGVYVEFNTTVNRNTAFNDNSPSDCGAVANAWDNANVIICGNTTFVQNSVVRGYYGRGGGVCIRSNSSVAFCGNTTFITNLASKAGGGVYVGSSSNVSIYESTSFNGNSAGDGGGIYVESNTSINITGDTTFIGNSARNNPMRIRWWGRWLVSKLNLAEWNGGGVYAESNSKLNISGNTKFIGNSANRLGGGVFAVDSNVSISRNTTFNGNTAKDGGGIYAGSNTTVNVGRNTAFNDVSPTDYSARINTQANTNVIISGNTTFIDNTARRHGGGVYAQSNCNVNLSGNTNFIENSGSFGGGVYIGVSINVDITGSTTFAYNTASDNGGGVYAALNSCLNIRGNTTFIVNSAKNGGCIFTNTLLNLQENNTFTNCSASNGGAIYAKEAQVEIGGTNVFSANRAAYLGGGLYVSKSLLNLIGNNTFTDNLAELTGGGIYAQETKISFYGTVLLHGNVAQLDGGAVYADNSNLSFSANLTIRNNTATLGGGIYSDNNTFTIDGCNVFENNFATYYGGGMYTRRSPLIVAGNNKFIANSAGEGGGIYATANSTMISKGTNVFIHNRAHTSGGSIWLDNSNLTLNGSNYFVESVSSYEGGAIFIYAAKLSLPGNNTFECNSAVTGGGIHARWSNVTVTNRSSSNFKHNIALFGGGVFTDSSTFKINGSIVFRGNQANHTGGGIHATRSVLNFLGTSSIIANTADRDGGGIHITNDCIVRLLGFSNYQENSAGDTGGGISAFRSSFNLAGQNTFNSNYAVEGGGFYAFKSTVNIPGESTFINNSASFQGGAFAVMHSTLDLNGSTKFRRNFASTGGGMYIGESTVDSNGSNCFMNNRANSEGGGIDAKNSVVEFHGKDVFVANTAGNKGAAVHVSFTTLIFQGSSSFASNSAEYGGGIYSKSSNLTFVSSHYPRKSCIDCKTGCNNLSTISDNRFVNNIALSGGAQYFDLSSNLSLYETVHMHFQDNHATEFGGAVYVADVPGPGHFLSQQHVPFRSECFFHILGKEQPLDLNTSPLKFVNNSAGIRGSVLYGGLLEKCNLVSDRYTSALELFNVSIHSKNYPISSDPTQLCFCHMSKLNCREATQYRSIYPGQQVVVSVAAIDQSGSTIPTLIHAKIRSGHSLIVSETISYVTGSNCTSRNYSVTPKSIFNQLELYPSNRSGNTVHLIVNIKFESCPIGFEQSNFTGECICDHRLWQYTNSCDISKQAIWRNATRTFWIGVSYDNETFEGYIHHHYCPLDYCTKKSKSINLNNPDKQCNHNRSGLLCGKCKKGLSLVLGSSQCKQCSNNYLALLVPFALAGVLLVILLFLLHLTVAAGTLHGLIFYANIVAANHHIFFPQFSNHPASIFIAWLNLDLGIETCFYDKMDAYAKAWLEFAFPTYIWVILGFLVCISDHSVTVTKILGSSPVPVLATLFFLSYAKILRTIIAALSLTILHYPHTNVVVWMHDANVSLSKYIPLLLVALLFLLFLFLPYTMLLLLGQWLQSKSHFSLLRWVRNPKVKAILDSYHAPYMSEHRYWTGLLLSLRCALFLAFAFNISGDASVNLLVISSVSFGIVVGFALLGKVYKSWFLNALELSFILNLGILAIATHFVLHSGGSQAAVAYTSVGIAFLTFVGIVIYHIYMRMKSKVQYIQRGYQLHGNNCHKNNNIDDPGSLSHQPKANPIITRTEVNLHELRSPLDLLSYHQMD